MQRNLFAALSGAIFGLGLLISGMTNTTKVHGWLDVFGNWDPTLAFVMGGAIIPMTIAWRIAAMRRMALLGTAMPLSQDSTVDAKLVLGSSLFGAGWGLAGLCPGPALASLGWGGWGGVLFLLAMVVGMVAAPAAKARIDRITQAA